MINPFRECGGRKETFRIYILCPDNEIKASFHGVSENIITGESPVSDKDGGCAVTIPSDELTESREFIFLSAWLYDNIQIPF